MTFRGKQWKRSGNCYNLVGYQIDIYQWNSGKNANFLVCAGYQNRNHVEKAFSKGPEARDAAIEYALSIKDKYRIDDKPEHGERDFYIVYG